MKARFAIVSIWLGCLASPEFAWGGPGSVSTQLGPQKDNAYSVALQPDGKIVAAGASFNGRDTDLMVARYRPNGSLDITFGEGGVAIFDSKLGDDKAYAVAIQNDGRIVVAGSLYNGKNQTFAILRFLSDGTLDPNFGRNGVTTTNFGKGDSAGYSIGLQADGKIVAAGYASNGNDLDFAVIRLESNGLFDFSFGRNGRVMTGLGDADNRGGDEHGYSVLLQGDGRIIVSGYSQVDDTSVIATIRYLPTGQVDRTFGIEGTTVTSIGKGLDKAYTAYLQRDGDILVAGSTQMPDNTQRFVVVRYLPNGIPDANFGENGVVTTLFGKGKDSVYALEVQPDGKIVAAGSYFDGLDTNLGLARYLPTGELDSTFGEGGKSLSHIDWKYSTAYGMAIQPDGRIVVGGVSSPGKTFHVAIARYLTTGNLDQSFGGGMLQVAGVARTPITAQMGLPSLLVKSLLERPEP
jgi:uncharacterized delta-60 repeat protein